MKPVWQHMFPEFRDDKTDNGNILKRDRNIVQNIADIFEQVIVTVINMIRSNTSLYPLGIDLITSFIQLYPANFVCI